MSTQKGLFHKVFQTQYNISITFRSVGDISMTLFTINAIIK